MRRREFHRRSCRGGVADADNIYDAREIVSEHMEVGGHAAASFMQLAGWFRTCRRRFGVFAIIRLD